MFYDYDYDYEYEYAQKRNTETTQLGLKRLCAGGGYAVGASLSPQSRETPLFVDDHWSQKIGPKGKVPVPPATLPSTLQRCSIHLQ